ncbi:MAG: hypothetical protein INQ03_20465 [Candidatus Heimdallarchaeota archaeon]|nr:hypothetical protein [Candidatus Heimdallarchaeota archaeon]
MIDNRLDSGNIFHSLLSIPKIMIIGPNDCVRITKQLFFRDDDFYHPRYRTQLLNISTIPLLRFSNSLQDGSVQLIDVKFNSMPINSEIATVLNYYYTVADLYLVAFNRSNGSILQLYAMLSYISSLLETQKVTKGIILLEYLEKEDEIISDSVIVELFREFPIQVLSYHTIKNSDQNSIETFKSALLGHIIHHF